MFTIGTGVFRTLWAGLHYFLNQSILHHSAVWKRQPLEWRSYSYLSTVHTGIMSVVDTLPSAYSVFTRHAIAAQLHRCRCTDVALIVKRWIFDWYQLNIHLVATLIYMMFKVIQREREREKLCFDIEMQTPQKWSDTTKLVWKLTWHQQKPGNSKMWMNCCYGSLFRKPKNTGWRCNNEYCKIWNPLGSDMNCIRLSKASWGSFNP